MAENKYLDDSANLSIMDTGATLADAARAVAEVDNTTELDFFIDILLYVPYDTTAPAAGAIAAHLWVLPSDRQTPVMYPVGGSTTEGVNTDPQGVHLTAALEGRNPTVLTAVGITAATQANPVVITDAAHGLTEGQRVYISGVVGMTEINDRFFEIGAVVTDTFELVGEDGLGHTAYTSGGTWWAVDVLSAPAVRLFPGKNRIVLKNVSGQTFSAEWELQGKPYKGQSV